MKGYLSPKPSLQFPCLVNSCARTNSPRLVLCFIFSINGKTKNQSSWAGLSSFFLQTSFPTLHPIVEGPEPLPRPRSTFAGCGTVRSLTIDTSVPRGRGRRGGVCSFPLRLSPMLALPFRTLWVSQPATYIEIGMRDTVSGSQEQVSANLVEDRGRLSRLLARVRRSRLHIVARGLRGLQRSRGGSPFL